jgi:hypothetical protein
MSVKLKIFLSKELPREIRFINKLILHCSDSDNPDHDNIETIRRWHVEERGFVDVGYHFFIRKDGTVEEGRPIQLMGAHCANHNLRSIGICLGGKHQFTDIQFNAAKKLCEALIYRFKIKKSEIYPHSHFNRNKSCPNFNLDKIM